MSGPQYLNRNLIINHSNVNEIIIIMLRFKDNIVRLQQLHHLLMQKRLRARHFIPPRYISFILKLRKHCFESWDLEKALVEIRVV